MATKKSTGTSDGAAADLPYVGNGTDEAEFSAEDTQEPTAEAPPVVDPVPTPPEDEIAVDPDDGTMAGRLEADGLEDISDSKWKVKEVRTDGIDTRMLILTPVSGYPLRELEIGDILAPVDYDAS